MVLGLVAVDNSSLEAVRVAGIMLDQLVDVVQFLHQKALVIAACSDVDEGILGSLEVAVVQKRRLQRLADCILNTRFSLAGAAAHQGHAAVVHHLLDILEVHVHESSRLDNVHYCANGCSEHFIGLREGVLDQQVAVEFVKFLVVDDQKTVHIGLQLVDTVDGP